MGSIEMKLGFDKKSMRVTVDGEPHGDPISLPFGEHDVRETVATAIRQTNRTRLMTGAARKAMVWAAMPKPPQGDA